MSRFAFDPYSPVYQRVIDGVVSAISFWLAYQALFEGHIPPSAAIQMWGLLLAISLGRICVNQVLGSYRTIWRYVGLRDAMALACSYAVFSLALVTLRYAVPSSVLRIPLGVILTELLLSFTGAAAVRVARRILYERIVARNLTRRKVVAVLLIGGGPLGSERRQSTARGRKPAAGRISGR